MDFLENLRMEDSHLVRPSVLGIGMNSGHASESSICAVELEEQDSAHIEANCQAAFVVARGQT